MLQALEVTALPLGGRSLPFWQPYSFVKLGSEDGARGRKKGTLQRIFRLGQRSSPPRQQSQLPSALISSFSKHSLPQTDVILLSTTVCWDGSILYKFGSAEQLMDSEAREKDGACGSIVQSDSLKLGHIHGNADNKLITKQSGPSGLGHIHGNAGDKLFTEGSSPLKLGHLHGTAEDKLFTEESDPLKLGHLHGTTANNLITEVSGPLQLGHTHGIPENKLITEEPDPLKLKYIYGNAENKLITEESEPLKLGYILGKAGNKLIITEESDALKSKHIYGNAENKLITEETIPLKLGYINVNAEYKLITEESDPLKLGDIHGNAEDELITEESSPLKLGHSYGNAETKLTTEESDPLKLGHIHGDAEDKLITEESDPLKLGYTIGNAENKLITEEPNPLKLAHIFANAENKLITEQSGPLKLGHIHQAQAIPAPVQLESFLHKGEFDQKQELKLVMDYPKERHVRGILAEGASEKSPCVSIGEVQFPNKDIGINSKPMIFKDLPLMGRARKCVNISKVEKNYLAMPKERCQISIETEKISSSNTVQEVVTLWNSNKGLDNAKFLRNLRTCDEEVGDDVFTSSTPGRLGFGGSQNVTIHPSMISEQGGEETYEHVKILQLTSGAAMLPHPDKESTGGEDAFFIQGSWVGVADGVAAWAISGIDSRHFARELMWNCAGIACSHMEKPNPEAVLQKAYNQTKALGSSTALVAALYQQTLFAVSVGDSGFLLIRNKKILAKSTPMQHAFNFPYQIGLQTDDASLGEAHEIVASEGDVLVLGTDGLFDNLFEDEIVKIVIGNLQSGGGPELAAKLLVQSAQILGARQEGSSPFAKAAAAARITYSGGKLDDVTAIVSYVM